MRIATAAPAADDGDDDLPGRRDASAANRDVATRAFLLRLGKVKFGKPPPDVSARLHELTLEEMELVAIRLLTASSWEELLNSV